ncbi:MAG: hypothetical protein AUJ31_01970 [Parcubacteria group bacterium CG1_02_39_15]|uniref:DUF11 domain-containing protein n=4 Tax=Candidatus Nealsoniibacteriota TaxID=1817911 RepID=A0A2G9YTB0_9BACT|nr:MAG: hypothetical protein AUJ31_01970 [Parcubacteria group bacterium CG1_02_39_15]PIP22467.1 MAG: hypothetical protein COX38_00480 [Candidatus Nealsonbacteria bacterium CG23_combo_of_CG06-09_8_20_14_all_39_25]PIQ98563.1 MAG: hypothetical protein COV64_00600 [Candidatus Nealsonbacteria bacterium CG11_big_fil_rev_8_21_14_0_20_39_9]PIW89875.1 MAG: hypothetical protein COZ92_02300 [Candidatus Nealsonbacteria bacterium CG_4_8_14_3_um_filter_40_11]PIZ88164.1 MAG: hypothetical protein COX91_01665 [
MRRKFIIFLIFLAAIAGGIGFWRWQENVYSKEILKLEILGKEGVALGEEFEYVVKYKNNGNIRLEEPELIFEYPKHSILVGETSYRITKSSADLGGAVYPGQEQSFHFKVRLLGKEGEAMVAKAWLSYRPKNLKARYESATTFTTQIKSVPLTFEFDLPFQVESGKEFKLSLNYFSNVDYPLSNLRIVTNYPSDFEFIDSTPRALEKNEWDIGLLNKATGGRVGVTGKLSGEIGEEKLFRAQLGSWQDSEFVLLKEAIKGIEIIKPSLYIWQQINGNPQYVAAPGDWLHYEIFFKNVGEDDLANLFLVSRLEGDAFDFQTIKSDAGDYEPGDNSIVFDWRRIPKLQFLPPMEEAKVEFWVSLKGDFGILKNPILKNKVFLSQAKEEFTTKINSKVVLIQKGYFQDEVFGNSGPLPPTVGGNTTYTVMWQVKNYYNQIKNVKVKAVLPKQVQLTGKIFPEEALDKFAFDSRSREIIWEIGDLDIGQGVITAAPNISFQVKFTPTEDQRGQTPEIIGMARVSGQDQWTKEIIEASVSAVNTALPDDSTITPEKGIIQ